jgi:hypothetical protein
MGKTRSTLDNYLAQYEDLWAKYDQIWAGFSDSDWLKPHGPDWTMDDLPYHCAYFDREILTGPLTWGSKRPESEVALPTINAVNAWNAERFEARADDYTAADALAEHRQARDGLRAVFARLSDADLEQQAFTKIFNIRWWTAEKAILTGISHYCNHLVELNGRLELEDGPMPTAETLHTAIVSYMGFLPYLLLDSSAAAGQSFSVRYELHGEGGGSWTLRLVDGQLNTTENDYSPVELELGMSALLYIQTLNGIADFGEAMQSGEIRVSDLDALGRFGQLFSPPEPDRILMT